MAQVDREALCAFFRSTKGPDSWCNTEGWNTDADLGLWFGVQVNAEGRVVELHLRSTFHKKGPGPIPDELVKLTALQHLNLSSNNLTGESNVWIICPIPDELGKLTALERLDLYGNKLTGPIPDELGKLTALQALHLSSNKLTGPIPDELGKLTALESLDLYGNELTGPIPDELGKLTALQTLHLSCNKLTGPIPDELGKLTALQTLNLFLNNLTGPIPDELGKLTALQTLQASNKLTGPIPDELGKLTALRYLSLSNNKLTGPIPDELGKLIALQRLILCGNKLTGPIPDELGKLTALHRLNLSINKLTGPIPDELGKLTALQDLDLSNNKLTGPIPDELGKLTALRYLSLSNNKLTGTIPDELRKLAAFRRANVFGNELTGLIPGEPEKLKSPARRRRSRFERLAGESKWVPSSKLEDHSLLEIPNPVSIKPTDDGSEDSDEESLQGKHKKLPLEEIKGIGDRSKMTKSSLDEVKIEDSEPDEPETLNFMGKLRRTFNRLTAWIPGTRSSQLEQHSVSEIPNASFIKPTPESSVLKKCDGSEDSDEESQGKQKKPSIEEMKGFAEPFEATESSLEAKIEDQSSDVGMSDDTQGQKEAEGMINNPGYHEESSRPEVVNDEEIVLTNCLGTQAAKFLHPAYGIELILEDKSLEHEIKKQVVVKPEIKIVECSQDRDLSRTHEELLALSSDDVASGNTFTFMVMPIVHGPSEATFHPDRPAKLRFFAGYLGDLQNELRKEGNDHCSNEDVKKHLRAVYEPLISADGHNWRMLPPVDVIFKSSDDNEATQVWLETRLYHFSMGSIGKLLPKLNKPTYEDFEHYEAGMPLWRRVVKNRGQVMLGNATKEKLVYYACKLSITTEHHARTEGGAGVASVQLSGARERDMTLHSRGLDDVMKYNVSAGIYKTVDMFMDGPVVQKQMLVGVFLHQPNNLVYLEKIHLRIGRVYAVLPKMINDWRNSPSTFNKTLVHGATRKCVLDFMEETL